MDLAAVRGDLVFWLLFAACVGARAPIPSPAPRVEVWVDAYALPGGDGTAARPLKTVPASLPRAATVHLASGIYGVAFALPEDVELLGSGVVVLSREGPGQVLEVTGGRLSNVSLQGGETGLVARGRVQLERVTFTGFSRVGLRVEPGATVSCAQCQVDGTIAGTVGISATGASLRVTQSRFTGGLLRGVEVQRGDVALERTESLGPRALLRAVDAAVKLVDVKAAGGTATAVVVSGGTLDVQGLTVVGHEYGLQVLRSRVRIEGLSSTGADGGASLEQSTGTVKRARFERSGIQGALVLLSSDLTIEDLEVHEARVMAVLVRKGRATFRKVRISQVTREAGTLADPELGDGLQLRDAQVTLDDVEVRDVEGSALYASNFAKITLGTLFVERTGAAAVVVDLSSELAGRRITLRGAHGPGVLLMNRGRAHLERLDASGVDVATWTDCERGAFIEVRQLVWANEVVPSRCEQLGR